MYSAVNCETIDISIGHGFPRGAKFSLSSGQVSANVHLDASQFIGIEENIDVLVFCGRTKSTAFSLCSSVHVSGKNKIWSQRLKII
jgi:hypothetical protein